MSTIEDFYFNPSTADRILFLEIVWLNFTTSVKGVKVLLQDLHKNRCFFNRRMASRLETLGISVFVVFDPCLMIV